VNVTVGVLTHNSEHTLPDLLNSLPEGLIGVSYWQLVIADSGSADRTIEIVKQLAPDAKLVELGGNKGFAAGVNAVAAIDPITDAVLILSPTVRLLPNCVKHLLESLDEINIGVVVPKLYSGQGEPRTSLRRRPTLARAWTEALVGGQRAQRIGTLSEVIADPDSYSAETKAEWATGAATLVSRACLDKVGPWDESFFLYSEETEFELRAADRGFRLVFSPRAKAIHLGGVSKVRSELWALTCANRVRLYGMRHNRLPTWAFWIAILFGEMMRWPVSESAVRRTAIGKLLRERSALVRGEPARRPYEQK
jgi:N-acetylglucosaminyl-diphospho-decaprenol L-rhamnosyltransferase